MRTALMLALWSWCVAAAPQPNGPVALVYFNREVVTLRAPLMGLSPAERVTAAQARLRSALLETTGSEVTVRPTELGHAVQLNGHLLFFVQAADLDPEAGLTLDLAAAQAAGRLRSALAQSVEQRSAEGLTRSFLALGGATLAFVALLAVLGRLKRKLVGWIEGHVRARPAALSLGTLSVVRWSTIGVVLAWVVRALTTGLMIGASVQWLAFGLAQFLYTQPWGERLEGFIVALLADGLLAAARVLPDVVVVVVIAWLSWAGMRLSRALFHQVEAGHWTTSWLTPQTAGVTRKLVSLSIVLLGVVMAYPYLPGSDTEAFKGISVLLGVTVSLGGSSTVGQAASGLILIYTRAFSVGDQVCIGDASGRVTSIGMFATRLLTHLGEELIIPNSAILQGTTRNYTRDGKTVLEVVVTIGYDVSWRRVEGLLREGAARTRALLTEPAPTVVVRSLDDVFVTYRLIALAADASAREGVLAELQRNVLDAFKDAEVAVAKRPEPMPLAS